MMRVTFTALTLCLFSHLLFSQKQPQAIYNLGKAAYEKKDYKKFLALMREADEILPNEPTITLQLARGYALTGRKSRSVQYLRKLMMLNAPVNFEEDLDLKSVIGYKGYQGVVNLRRMLLTDQVNDELYRTVEADSLHPESFVILENGELILGSVRQKKIVKVDSAGRIWDWLEMPYSVLGMKVDQRTGHIWAASSAMPEMIGYKDSDRGNSVIFEIDPTVGTIIQAIGFDEEELYGDLVMDSKSRIWLTNSMSPYLSRDVTDSASFLGAFVRKQFDLATTHYNLQGLSLNDDESLLYFADYRSGIHRLNIAEDDIDKVQHNSDFMPIGIDGLYFYKNSLIAMHNGVKPFKVVQYYLDNEGENIIGERTINRGGHGPGEPTLGQIKDGYFYYIANSPWGAYDDQGKLILDKVSPLQIRRFKLD